jgi:hypothetical protein
MSILFWLLAGIVFLFWLFGLSQPLANKPEILRGPLGGLGGLALVIVLAIIAVLI